MSSEGGDPNVEIVLSTIERECGFVDDPVDRGGATKFGITEATLADWRGRRVSAAEVRELSIDEAVEIYLERYMYRPRIDELADRDLRELIFDCAVNHGPGKAVEFLQDAVGVETDGVIGPVTLDAVASEDPCVLHLRVAKRRLLHYGEIVRGDASQRRFIVGWLSRAISFLREDLVSGGEAEAYVDAVSANREIDSI